MDQVSHDIKSMVAGELLTIADELNEESMLTIDRIIEEHTAKIERNL